MPAGRPTKYKPEYCDLVIDLMKQGASMQEVALEIEVNIDTLYEWIKVHDTFSEAIKRGKSFSEGWWMKKGRISLNNGSFNSTLWYMNMKNRFHWRDKHEMQSIVTVTTPVSIDDLEAQIQNEESREE